MRTLIVIAMATILWSPLVLAKEDIPPPPKGFDVETPPETVADYANVESLRLSLVLASRKRFDNRKFQEDYRTQLRRMLRMDDMTRNEAIGHAVFRMGEDVDLEQPFWEEFLTYYYEVRRDAANRRRNLEEKPAVGLNQDPMLTAQVVEFAYFYLSVLKPRGLSLGNLFKDLEKLKGSGKTEWDEFSLNLSRKCTEFLLESATSLRVKKFIAMVLVGLPSNQERLNLLAETCDPKKHLLTSPDTNMWQFFSFCAQVNSSVTAEHALDWNYIFSRSLCKGRACHAFMKEAMAVGLRSTLSKSPQNIRIHEEAITLLKGKERSALESETLKTLVEHLELYKKGSEFRIEEVATGPYFGL